MTWHQLGSRPRPALEDKLPRGRPRASAWARDNDAASGAGAPFLSFPFPLAAGRPPKPRPRAPRDEVVSRADRPAAWIASAPMMVVRSRRVAREGWPGRDAVAAVSHSFCVFFSPSARPSTAAAVATPAVHLHLCAGTFCKDFEIGNKKER